MDTSDLLTTLTDLQDKNEKNADKYIREIQDFLMSSSGGQWDDRHRKVFQMMESRFKIARIYGMILFGVIILIVLGAGYFIFEKLRTSNVQEVNTALVDLARSSTLPLELIQKDQNADFLNVRVHNYFEDLNPEQKNKVEKLIEEFPSLGRAYGLGTNKLLNAKLESSNKNAVEASLLIAPGEGGTILGKLDLASAVGVIWPATGVNSIDARQQFLLDHPIEYESGATGFGLFLEITEYNRSRNKWTVRFREGSGGWSRDFFITKTLEGDINEPTFLVYEEGWSAVYSVTMGIGKYGQSDDGEVDYAWFVRSFARKLSF